MQIRGLMFVGVVALALAGCSGSADAGFLDTGRAGAAAAALPMGDAGNAPAEGGAAEHAAGGAKSGAGGAYEAALGSAGAAQMMAGADGVVESGGAAEAGAAPSGGTGGQQSVAGSPSAGSTQGGAASGGSSGTCSDSGPFPYQGGDCTYKIHGCTNGTTFSFDYVISTGVTYSCTYAGSNPTGCSGAAQALAEACGNSGGAGASAGGSGGSSGGSSAAGSGGQSGSAGSAGQVDGPTDPYGCKKNYASFDSCSPVTSGICKGKTFSVCLFNGSYVPFYVSDGCLIGVSAFQCDTQTGNCLGAITAMYSHLGC